MIRIDEKEMCCGCTACVSICPRSCITMKEDEEGFFYPSAREQDCIDCGLCTSVCPMLNEKAKTEETVAYAVCAKDDGLREQSSSGGVFSLIAGKVIDQGGYVFGCALDSKFVAEHTVVREASELAKLRGSKYVQSDLKDTFEKVKGLLEEGKEVLFCGTSCQAEGLKQFLRKPYDTLFIIDIVCHGVPSPKVWERYKAYQEAKYASRISDVSFRDKRNGWKNYRVRLSFQNGQTYLSRSWDDVYMKSYLKNIISRPACYDCKFRKWQRQSDLTLGDFWGIEQVLPEWNGDKGVSLVLVHTKAGSKMLQSLAEQIRSKEVSRESAVRKNPSVIVGNAVPKEREKFFRTMNAKGYDTAVRKYVRDSFGYKLKNLLRRLKK